MTEELSLGYVIIGIISVVVAGLIGIEFVAPLYKGKGEKE